jgi:hypothetical protein
MPELLDTPDMPQSELDTDTPESSELDTDSPDTDLSELDTDSGSWPDTPSPPSKAELSY